MNWILDNLQIVVLLALAFASWLKMRYDKNAEEGLPPPDPTVWDEEEEEVWPRESTPPPLMRTVVAAPVPPPLPTAAAANYQAVLDEQRAIQERLRKIRQPRKAAPGHPRVAAPALLAGQLRRPRRGDPAGFLGKSLQDPLSVRRAVALREILGPPVGLR